MTSLTSPDNLVRWTTSDPASIVAPNNQLADSVQAALLLRAAKSYEWANKAARDAQVGMQAGHTGYQTDIAVYWYYDGTRWQPMTITAFATLSVLNTQIPTPTAGMIVRIATDLWPRRYNGTVWRPYGSGMLPIKPTSVAGTGVTLGVDGNVSFTTATNVSMNGVVTTDFTHYLISAQYPTKSAAGDLVMRLRNAGTDVTTGGSYWSTRNYSSSTTTTFNVVNNAADSGFFVDAGGTATTLGGSADIEFMSDNRNVRSSFANTLSSGNVVRGVSGGYTTNSTYDGFTLYPTAGNWTGSLQVYGFNRN